MMKAKVGLLDQSDRPVAIPSSKTVITTAAGSFGTESFWT
jgi:hypothetical protein